MIACLWDVCVRYLLGFAKDLLCRLFGGLWLLCVWLRVLGFGLL